MMENSQVERLLLVCQNRTCKKQGSAKVLATFQTFDIPNITVEKSGCLGKCGSGPMVLVLPEEVWYSHVEPQNISAVMERHLLS
ncbi:MAG: (2Fe-2S) ferredoxin domain-containing protein [Okeania sp. SIO2F4]|uniref:(2Fe-2S) ferredoxin domain-containing protein n=1 Tax=Okeania sp. SIO2F4 TaxID=2607790 RepID=UPI00142966F4|nr:(2Fe-2S) ferredoxin domain-containing protein [Okeania sp. SIO2F4]NES05231.1 (2Fe-2S) ferredoxin domain-containing protein [Okeania sp. SIO2F4]